MKKLKKWIAAILTVTVLFSLSGCRFSPVVEKIIYDRLRAEYTDMEKNTFDNQEDNETPDDVLKDLTYDDSSQRDTEVEPDTPTIAPEDVSPTNTQQTAGTPEYAPSGADTTAPAQGDPTPMDDGTLPGGETDELPEEPADGEEEPSGAPEPVPDPNDNGSGDNGGSGAEGTYRSVVDAYGKAVQIPENVETVAAVDSAAVAVLMLGGVSCLAATDKALAADSLASAVFSGLSSVPALWEGDGTAAPLSSSGLEKLIALHPDVCLETSGCATFSEDQVARLKENGISYLVLPAPSSMANVKIITQTVATVLGDHSDNGGYNSADVASSYLSWVDSAAASAQSATSGYYTLYVDSWDSQAYYSVEGASGYQGYGCAVISNARTAVCGAVSSYLSAANVTNVTSLGAFTKVQQVYFTPLHSTFTTITVAGDGADSKTTQKLLELADNPGSAAFPVIIAGNQAAKAGIESSPLWVNFGRVVTGDNNFLGYGFLDDEGSLVRTSIIGDYSVVVNPTGVGDWATGSVESILETVWAAYAVTGAYTEEQVRDAVSEFYTTFYHYDLSEAQLDGILAGE